MLSDVVGDPLDVIASGPTVADTSSYADALAVIDALGVTSLPQRAVQRLQVCRPHFLLLLSSILPEAAPPASLTRRVHVLGLVMWRACIRIGVAAWANNPPFSALDSAPPEREYHSTPVARTSLSDCLGVGTFCANSTAGRGARLGRGCRDPKTW